MAPSHYPELPAQPNFPEIEQAILARWKAERIFERSVDERPAGENGSNEYVFYDGPPFANGLPHYGHLVTGYVKDIIPRYHTMKGRRVERRFGWDCHGLPAEMEAEKEIGVSGRAAIMEYGIEKFNESCRTSVLKYTQEWEDYVTRQARWVDFSNDYKTLDLPYMESVIWAFGELHRKGLVYEGHKVVPYSWSAETILSNFETRLDDSYRERQDPALTVRFRLHGTEGQDPLTLLVWTTTPWTLPSNLALAVGDAIEYRIHDVDGERVALASTTVGKYADFLEKATEVGTVLGKDLVGRTYDPIFPYFKDHPNSFRVLSGEFVNTEEGTGVVHMAPGFGEDDQLTCEAEGIELVCPVDHRGAFTSEVSDYVGVNVLEANKAIIKDLKTQGVVAKHETYLHNYPHCWRTDEPLIYKAVSSWYVKVTEFRDRMVELNQGIRWIPEHVRDGSFGKWLQGARDWAVSRSRFWGTPIPVWKSDDPAHPRVDVYGSLEELERDFGVKVEDLHRPYIDQLTRPNPDDPTGKSTMRRVEDVFDCWFESGSMPYAQVHYPFENKEWFEDHFPADFIVEYIAQTRGWFYTMMVLSTALFDRPPFQNCICHGVVLDENNRKLSKRLRNYPSPQEVYSTVGSDALRWFLTSSTILKGHNLVIDREGKGIAAVVKLVINPLWNAYAFFCMYANSDGVQAKTITNPGSQLDRYILAKTHELVRRTTEVLDAYDIPAACQEVRTFLDALNNWYIRRSRNEFWKSETDDAKTEAYDTLYTVLTTLCRAAAPLLPLLTEEIYRGLTGEESVHLSSWPSLDELNDDEALVRSMDRVRDICSTAHSIREAHSIRTRQPLASLTIVGQGGGLEEFHELIRDEVNVKQVVLSEAMESYGEFRLQVNAPVVGPRLGKDMKTVMTASRSGDWKPDGDGIAIAGLRLEPGEFELRLQPREGVACQALPGNDGLVVLDLDLTPELEQEGMARDIVRLIQQARKDHGFHISDRIALHPDGSTIAQAAFDAHRDYICEQTLTAEVTSGADGDGWQRVDTKLLGEPYAFAIKKQA